MKLLSKELVSHDYRSQLQIELAKATVCRFLVAYVSGNGIESIGRHLLNRVLRDSRSFGVASISCSCGYDPLVQLQSELPDVRLKYFMDPLVKEDGEPSGISLFHSKMVYLWLEREGKSVVYIGSHNWTRRALGPQGPRNAEASIRFEMEFAPDDLDGTGTSIASHVNRHLLDAWNLPLCLPATRDNNRTFEDWYQKGCRRSPASPLEKSTILLAVRRSSSGAGEWLELEGRGVYLQVLDEEDGKLVWESNNRLIVLVWNSETDLATGQQPIILLCTISTTNAGRDSEVRGTNTSAAPVAGFEAVIWDEAELSGIQSSQGGRRPAIRLWSGREVHVYDFEFPTPHADSSQIDGTVRPKYQFHLQVERVIVPEGGDFPRLPDYVWTPESFSVAASKDDARVEETPGYAVEPQRERQMMECLRNVLFVQPEHAKVLPFSSGERLKVGKRISTHPLHEAFLGPQWQDKSLRDRYYESSEEGALVADLDAPRALIDATAEDEPEELPRLQRVFTSPVKRLLQTWSNAAKLLRSKDVSRGDQKP